MSPMKRSNSPVVSVVLDLLRCFSWSSTNFGLIIFIPESDIVVAIAERSTGLKVCAKDASYSLEKPSKRVSEFFEDSDKSVEFTIIC